MRADWFIEMVRSWDASCSLSREDTTQCSRLVKAASISAGGRVACTAEHAKGHQLRSFAHHRARAALDRYARARHGTASFEAFANSELEPQRLLAHLRDAVAYIRERKADVDAFARDTLYEEFLEWEAAEAAGQAFAATSFAINEVKLLRDSEYAPAAEALLQEAKQDVIVAVGLIVCDGTPTHPVTPLLEALRYVAARGVRVKILTGDIDSELLTDTKMHRRMRRTMERLEDSGAQVVKTKRQRAFHIKAVIVDERVVIVGSHNWTGTSLAEHAELSVLLNAPALAKSFARRLGELAPY